MYHVYIYIYYVHVCTIYHNNDASNNDNTYNIYIRYYTAKRCTKKNWHPRRFSSGSSGASSATKTQRRVWQSAVDAWHYRMSIPVSPAALPKRQKSGGWCGDREALLLFSRGGQGFPALPNSKKKPPAFGKQLGEGSTNIVFTGMDSNVLNSVQKSATFASFKLGYNPQVDTLPETNIAPENGWLEY